MVALGFRSSGHHAIRVFAIVATGTTLRAWATSRSRKLVAFATIAKASIEFSCSWDGKATRSCGRGARGCEAAVVHIGNYVLRS
jgi:hypothetical protein